MGCDIHLFSEVKINGEWYCHSSPNIERWYALFEKMAGVRGEDKNAVSLPKGLPNDLSVVVKKYHEFWNGDAHSESWLTSSEIEKVEEWLEEKYKGQTGEYKYPEKEWGYLFGSSYGGFYKYPDPIIEDVRFVFWFDN